MGWLRLHILCNPAQPGHEIATAWLSDAGCSMFEETDEGLQAYGKEEELDAALLEVIRQDLKPVGLDTWRASLVEEENWNAKWEEDYPEVIIGEDIRVRAPFHPEHSEVAFDHVLTVQPRMAFGTGHHGTTYGLLAEMVQMTWEGITVLDMGCGSGVLGIYAAQRGATSTLFIDIDPWSVRNTQENLSLNGLSESEDLKVREGGAGQLKGSDTARFDVVIANINRNILLEDMAAYGRALKPSGTLMLSGFMEPDVPALCAAAASEGLTLVGKRQEEEWRILTLRR
ncbi:MAG: 50S ribosomal protein L11 methyltransferase [Flavobacteriales bacterium]|nr:50S ribosomal protein L11 methyltransferase [Flavobacteriales bacterium]